MPWSFQLYSARNFQPWDNVLKTLAGLGYREVEGFGGVYGDARAFRAALDSNGLVMSSGHFSIDMLEKELDDSLRVAKTLGMKLIACPHIAADARPKDTAGWKEFGRRLGKIGSAVRKAGFDFAWHNHDFEFAKLADGSVPQTHILDAAPEIGWEMDVAWVIRGGADPEKWIADYSNRISAVHVKDIAPKGEKLDEDGWSDVGHGTVDWKALYKTFRSKTPASYFIMEHDKPSDYERFARRSIEAANAF